MSMIVCPGCGKEVSDKANVCPRCDCILKPEDIVTSVKCEECETEYDSNLEICPNCGCPNAKKESEEEPQKVEVTKVAINKKKVFLVIGIIVAIVALTIGAVLNKQKMDEKELQKKEKAYYTKLETVTIQMLSGCVKAESTAGLIHDVWRNAIYEESDVTTDKYTQPNGWFVDDFNDALAELYKDSSFNSDVEAIEDNQDSVQKNMKGLRNPPNKYKEAYNELKEFYDCYIEFTNLAVNPSGSLTSYTSDYNDLDAEVMSKYKKMKMYLEE